MNSMCIQQKGNTFGDIFISDVLCLGRGELFLRRRLFEWDTLLLFFYKSEIRLFGWRYFFPFYVNFVFISILNWAFSTNILELYFSLTKFCQKFVTKIYFFREIKLCSQRIISCARYIAQHITMIMNSCFMIIILSVLILSQLIPHDPVPFNDMQNPPSLRSDHIYIKDAQYTEMNEKNNFAIFSF